jgi:transposase
MPVSIDTISLMSNRHNNTPDTPIDLQAFFDDPPTPRQRHYETIRALVKDGLSAEEAGFQFGYSPATVLSLLRDARSGRLSLFPTVTMGPKRRRTEDQVQAEVIRLRQMENLSTPDIQRRMASAGMSLSVKTVERILHAAGFAKLKRRTDRERGVTRKNKLIPERAAPLDFETLEPFTVDCPVAGVFFFIPYILESGLLEVVRECELPESSVLGAESAALSMLLLKLIGNPRLSHLDRYDHEPGLGLFAGLNVLPKATYMGTYSCRTSEAMLMKFQQGLLQRFRQTHPKHYGGRYINLDFHAIPHYGDLAEMEKVWCGARGKAMRGAETVFAQDAESNLILYARADILRREAAQEVAKFVAHWRTVKGGKVDETLVFDCHFTNYDVLGHLDADEVKFITLRKRIPKLIAEVETLPDDQWRQVTVPILSRKYSCVSVYESKVSLAGCARPLRQVVVKDHGRERPTFIVTNNWDLALGKLLEVYAKRWHIENKLAELVAFFNLNALSSPLMVRIHFDILWTMIADTLYHRLTQDLRRHEHHLAPTIFRKFIDFPGKVSYRDGKIQVRIRKRGCTPILLGVDKLTKPFPVPWLDGRTIEIVWSA